MRHLIILWFKNQAANAGKKVLSAYFSKGEINELLSVYWKRYLKLKTDVPTMPTIGGSVAIHLAAMSTAFYEELISRKISEQETTQIFYDIAWKVYKKMGKFSWWIAGIGNQESHSRLLKATQLFRAFPFNSPSYNWEDVQTNNKVVGFNCTKCPVAEYFQEKNMSKFCVNTWCKLDYPLAELWNSKLERSGSIASGAEICDFRWIANENKINLK
jgi:L-2-amino-thiazoline-4-carboxylic acid hydrolase-like protein